MLLDPSRFLRRLVSPWFVRLMLVTGVAQLVVTAIRPLITYQSIAAGAGAMEVGLITAAFSALSLFAAIPLGKAVDRHGEVGFLVLGCVTVTVTLVALMLPLSLALLGLCTAVLGLGHLVMVASAQTLIAKGTSLDVRDGRFATLTGINGTIQVAGPALTGLVIGGVVASTDAESGSLPKADLVFGIVAVGGLLACLSAVSLKLRPGALTRRKSAELRDTRRAVRRVMALPAVPTAMLASMTVLTCVDLLTAYLPVLGEAHGLTVRTVGLLLAAEGVTAMLVRFSMLRLIARFTRRRLLVITMGLAGAAVAAIPVAVELLDQPVPVLFALMALAGAGLGVGQPATMAWVATQTPPELRGTSVSIRLTGNRIGLVAVPLCAGALAGSLGVAAAFWWPALLLVLSAVLVLRAGRHIT
jgi:MFS family permease